MILHKGVHMNEKCAKRIRKAASILFQYAKGYGLPEYQLNYRATLTKLKKEYRILPYHRRRSIEIVSHSTRNRQKRERYETI